MSWWQSLLSAFSPSPPFLSQQVEICPTLGWECDLGGKAKLREREERVQQPSAEDIAEWHRGILEQEISKKGDHVEPFNENCWKESSGNNMAGVAQISGCVVRSTANLHPDSTMVGMVQSTRLLLKHFWIEMLAIKHHLA